MVVAIGFALWTAVVAEARAQAADPPVATDLQQKGGTLSDKLHRSDGVMKPQGDVDPQMHKPAPDVGSMQVVPAPGTPGGNPDVTPK